MKIYNYSQKRCILGHLDKGADLLLALTELAIQQKIQIGSFYGLGAVEKAALGCYNQKTRQYEQLQFPQPMEIASCVGNISIKDDKPFVHAHLVLADDKGHCVGGHLMPNTKVFAFEFNLSELSGSPAVRRFDANTDLFLWND